MSDGNIKKTMTDKNANTEIRKEFCPNCEADVPCTHEAELFVCDICGEDFAKYIVSRCCNVSDVSVTRDVLTPESIENPWIPVSERLPEYGKAVLIMTTTSVLPRIGRHSPTIPQWATTDMLYYHDISYSEVTHWMPLPEPPESEE